MFPANTTQRSSVWSNALLPSQFAPRGDEPVLVLDLKPAKPLYDADELEKLKASLLCRVYCAGVPLYSVLCIVYCIAVLLYCSTATAVPLSC
jgi:hypothetical protein